MKIWTIGHSTRTLSELLDLLGENDITTLADIRSFPGSRRHPHFNKESLIKTVPAAKIEYLHVLDLGGRRKINKDSLNVAWKNASFRSYADYMETELFSRGVAEIESIAQQENVCYMCSEAVWWRCHRSMVSDHMKSRGWDVMHIMGAGFVKEHKYTSPSNILSGKLSYRGILR